MDFKEFKEAIDIFDKYIENDIIQLNRGQIWLCDEDAVTDSGDIARLESLGWCIEEECWTKDILKKI